MAAVAIDLVLALAYVSFRFRFNLQGRGEPSGFWAVAGGAQMGPLALSAVVARGVALSVQLQAFGKKLWSRAGRKPREEAKESPEGTLSERVSELLATTRQRHEKLARWLDPLDLLSFLIRERRRIRFEPTRIDLDYSFVDIATTGKVLGAIYAFSALLPGIVVVCQNPSWQSEDRAALSANGSIRVFPGLLLVDAAWFLIRNTKLRRTNGRKGAREAT